MTPSSSLHHRMELRRKQRWLHFPLRMRCKSSAHPHSDHSSSERLLFVGLFRTIVAAVNESPLLSKADSDPEYVV